MTDGCVCKQDGDPDYIPTKSYCLLDERNEVDVVFVKGSGRMCPICLRHFAGGRWHHHDDKDVPWYAARLQRVGDKWELSWVDREMQLRRKYFLGKPTIRSQFDLDRLLEEGNE